MLWQHDQTGGHEHPRNGVQSTEQPVEEEEEVSEGAVGVSEGACSCNCRGLLFTYGKHILKDLIYSDSDAIPYSGFVILWEKTFTNRLNSSMNHHRTMKFTNPINKPAIQYHGCECGC